MPSSLRAFGVNINYGRVVALKTQNKIDGFEIGTYRNKNKMYRGAEIPEILTHIKTI